MRLSARQWYDTAHGFYIDGSREYQRYMEKKEAGDEAKSAELFKKSLEQYENAVEYYRRAIGQARKADVTDVLTRLQVEPKAWLEMGLAYHKMTHYYEAVIAYQALRTNFMEKYRKRWMPDPKKDKKFYTSKAVKKALKALGV